MIHYSLTSNLQVQGEKCFCFYMKKYILTHATAKLIPQCGIYDIISAENIFTHKP